MFFNIVEHWPWSSKDTKQIKEEISKRISTKISMKVENINETINKSVTEISTNVANEQIKEYQTNSSAHARAINEIKGIKLVARGKGSVINLKQDANAAAQMAAIVEMIEDVETKNDIASKISSELSAKLFADAKSKSELIETTKLNQLTSQQQGLANVANNMMENVANTVQSVVRSLTGSETSENIDRKVEEIINTEIDNQIKNVNLNENDVKNNLETIVKNTYKTLSKDECLADAEARNLFAEAGLAALDGAVINVYQFADANSIASCLSKKNIGSKTFSGITNDTLYKSILESSTKSDTDTKMDKTTETTIQNIITDAFADMFKNFTDVLSKFGLVVPIIIGVIILLIVLAIIGVGVFLFMRGKFPNLNSEEENYEMEGGAIAIHTLQRGIILVALLGGIDYIAKKFK